MKRIIAYTLFWFGMGMLLMLMLENEILGIVLIAVCLITSFLLFGC